MIGMVRRAWADHQTFQHVIGTSVCLSCLLEGGRYDELHELLATRRMKSWSSHRFGAEALVRQGLWEGAIGFAEAARSANPGFSEMSIDRFCEKLLIDHGRADEAYRRYGLRPASGTTNLSVFRSLVRTYPDRDHRRILLDLIEPAATRANGLRPRKSLGFSTSLSSVPPRKAQTHRRWSEQPEISAAKSRNSPPLSRCLLSRPFSLAGAMTQACRKSTPP
jgi:hypothetical protein